MGRCFYSSPTYLLQSRHLTKPSRVSDSTSGPVQTMLSSCWGFSKPLQEKKNKIRFFSTTTVLAYSVYRVEAAADLEAPDPDAGVGERRWTTTLVTSCTSKLDPFQTFIRVFELFVW